MKQVLQNISNGLTSIEDVPHPKPIDDHVLISSSKSLVSSETEKMLMDLVKLHILIKLDNNLKR